jgi:arylsulfatase A-like enzyme
MSRRPSLCAALVVALIASAFAAGCSSCDKREAPAAAGRKQPPDIILISIDTLRADRLGAYGYGKGTSPRLDAFAREGALFAAHHAAAPVTLPSHASLFTGLDPDHNGVLANGFYRLGDRAKTLAERLSAEGYATGAIIACSTLALDHGLGQGFARYDARFEALGKIPEIKAEQVTDRAIAWLGERGRGERIFLFVHYYDPHKPYEAPARFAFDDPYDAEVAYVDEQIARLFKELARLDRYDRALIAVTADHGQSLGEHGLEGHSGILYEQTLHIPLVIRFPGGRGRGARVAAPTRTVDVMPTLLAAAGLPVPDGLDGADLSGLVRGDVGGAPRDTFSLSAIGYLPLLDQVSLISGNWKLVSKTKFAPTDDLPMANVQLTVPKWMASYKIPEELRQKVLGKYLAIAAGSPDTRQLFDLSGDPAETKNMYGAHPDVAKALEARIQGRGDPRPNAPGELFIPGARLEEKLTALGYLW